MARDGKKRVFDEEGCVERALELLREGKYQGYIKSILHRELNMPLPAWTRMKEKIAIALKERTDIIAENARQLQLERLENLLDDCITNGDVQMALKVMQEENKMLNVYEQKVNITTNQYQLKID